MRVLVTGGTGDLGRRVVERLSRSGHEVLVGTRTPRSPGHVRFDLTRELDPGLLDGVEAVVHLASDPLHPTADVDGSRRLFEEAGRAGVAHVLYVSIVGIDRHPFPYYRRKLEVESELERAGIPHTILRATQFHGLVPRFVDEAIRRIGVVPVPGGVRLQPIDADVVADRVVAAVESGPSRRVGDLGGPEVLDLGDMVRGYLRARGRKVPRFRVPAWGESAAAFRRGEQLAPGREARGLTYGQYLETLPRLERDPVAVWLRVVGAILLAITAWMLLWPAGFHSVVAGFGELNTHFVRDTGTFVFPLAAALWLAASRPGWRVPVLVLALLQNGLHVVNHAIDLGASDPAWHGPVNLVSLLGLEAVLWLLLRAEWGRASSR